VVAAIDVADARVPPDGLGGARLGRGGHPHGDESGAIADGPGVDDPADAAQNARLRQRRDPTDHLVLREADLLGDGGEGPLDEGHAFAKELKELAVLEGHVRHGQWKPPRVARAIALQRLAAAFRSGPAKPALRSIAASARSPVAARLTRRRARSSYRDDQKPGQR
jgi:hypothetical protein